MKGWSYVPLWGLIALGVGALLLIGALAVMGFLSWRSLERRYLVRLISRREAVFAVRQALEEAVIRLAEGSDEQLQLFADDPDSHERKMMHEVRIRSQILRDELDTMSLPKRLVPAAESLADAAYIVNRESAKIKDNETGSGVLAELGTIDLGTVAEVFERAAAAIALTCQVCDVEEDAAVYGGGLYL
ncbi:MAG: hypothetical protein HGB10_08840 [Coriobacteriia bacterium]|nr:hypothetical protein [Coriobacteriia bacterium]